MKLSVDTKEDSADDIRKVIRMLQHIVGEDSAMQAPDLQIQQETAGQDAPMESSVENTAPTEQENAKESIFSSLFTNKPEMVQQPSVNAAESLEEVSQSTEDLFAELFSDEEIKKMDEKSSEADEIEEEPRQKPSYKIELY